MELVGNENRIRALFSELSFEDQSRAPRFDKVWRRAENAAPVPVSNFRPAIAFAAAVIVAACIFSMSSWFNEARNIPPQITQITQITPVFKGFESKDSSKRSHPPRKKRLRHEPATEPAITEAAMLWSWQSPTSILMQSPTTLVLNTLPQLNQSAEELKQFLPKDHEVKESNQ